MYYKYYNNIFQERLEEKHNQEIEDLRAEHNEAIILQEQEMQMKFDNIIDDLHNKHSSEVELLTQGNIPTSTKKDAVESIASSAEAPVESKPSDPSDSQPSDPNPSDLSDKPSESIESSQAEEVTSTTDKVSASVTKDSARSSSDDDTSDEALKQTVVFVPSENLPAVSEGVRSDSELLSKHESELQALRDELAERHQNEISNIEARHEEALEQLQLQHQVIVLIITVDPYLSGYLCSENVCPDN